MQRRQLRRGDIVEVRSASEILATLDDNASLDAMPFMPEMLRYVGKRFTVSRRVEKICDTAGLTYLSRRMRTTVILEDLRCDGSAHGGCQAGCRLYWNEAWLRHVDSTEGAPGPDDDALGDLSRLAQAATTSTPADAEAVSGVTYSCQATQALAASEPIGRFDATQYAREVTSGNSGPLHVVWVLVREFARKLARVVSPRNVTRAPQELSSSTSLDLLPGDIVQVRSQEEIAATLSPSGKNRGLWFDPAMAVHCGRTYRVRDRVKRFIDEPSGKMVTLSTDCLVLDGVVCTGECSSWRWFCPRGIYPFWREAWLRKIDDRATSPPT